LAAAVAPRMEEARGVLTGNSPLPEESYNRVASWAAVAGADAVGAVAGPMVVKWAQKGLC
jgi:hypothetical protein